MKNFQKQIKGNVDFELSGTLKKAVIEKEVLSYPSQD